MYIRLNKSNSKIKTHWSLCIFLVWSPENLILRKKAHTACFFSQHWFNILSVSFCLIFQWPTGVSWTGTWIYENSVVICFKPFLRCKQTEIPGAWHTLVYVYSVHTDLCFRKDSATWLICSLLNQELGQTMRYHFLDLFKIWGVLADFEKDPIK